MEGKAIDRYFIAIVPSGVVYDNIQFLKDYISDRYKIKAALKSPPHITLHMPFEWKHTKEKILCDKLQSFFITRKRFELDLQNFSAFSEKTIFINVIITEELKNLESDLHRFCKKELNLFNARYQDLPFHPHITIAFRDLNKTTFAEVWNEFKERKFEARCSVLNITLLKHNGQVWKPLAEFLLN